MSMVGKKARGLSGVPVRDTSPVHEGSTLLLEIPSPDTIKQGLGFPFIPSFIEV